MFFVHYGYMGKTNWIILKSFPKSSLIEFFLNYLIVSATSSIDSKISFIICNPSDLNVGDIHSFDIGNCYETFLFKPNFSFNFPIMYCRFIHAYKHISIRERNFIIIKKGKKKPIQCSFFSFYHVEIIENLYNCFE